MQDDVTYSNQIDSDMQEVGFNPPAIKKGHGGTEEEGAHGKKMQE
jgi:hypothetical protein